MEKARIVINKICVSNNLFLATMVSLFAILDVDKNVRYTLENIKKTFATCKLFHMSDPTIFI